MNPNKPLNRMIRVPKRVLESRKLTSEEKIFYIILLDNIAVNETTILPMSEVNGKTRGMLKKLKYQKAIQSWTETPSGILVKFDLKEFLSDEFE